MHYPNDKQRLSDHPALTGMRGIAVTLIFLFHCNVPGFTGAFIGVDLFFVLSGFLITALLLQEHQQRGSIKLKKFYIRRILRLAPALLLFLSSYLAFMFIYHQDSATRLLHFQDSLLVFFYLANWTRAFGMDRPYVLGHCWSLSIEEQFYLLWPLVVIVLVRFAKSHRSLIIGVLLLLPWLWRSYLLFSGADWNRLYNGFDTRADALLAGCLLASLWQYGKFVNWTRYQYLTRVLTVAAVLGIGWFTVFARWQSSSLYLWQYTIVFAATVVLIIDIVHRPQGILARFLSLPILVGLGTISYGIYLWHYPIVLYVTIFGVVGVTAVILSATLTLLAATLSWFLIERPALRLKKKYVVVDRV